MRPPALAARSHGAAAVLTGALVVGALLSAPAAAQPAADTAWAEARCPTS
jgi:hypothetical protein